MVKHALLLVTTACMALAYASAVATNGPTVEVGPNVSRAPAGERVWTFDHDSPGKIPPGFTSALTGRGNIGEWVVVKDPDAPSPPNVLAQTSQDKTDYRFPLLMAEGASYKDIALGVRFKTISGTVDQAAGLVFRLRDKDNYYIVRANALEGNFRLYHVVNGKRVQFAGANFKVTPQTWHEIKVEARGDKLKCSYDGQVWITATDNTFQDAGKIGLWTKADSVTYFDDLTARDLSGTAGATRPKPLAQKLVDDLVARHPELIRVGVHVTPPSTSENIIIASNIPAKVGQKSDPEDLKAMQSGQPVILREGNNFDVTVPLHDSAGRIIGALGLTFKPEPSEQETDVLRRAGGISRELERQIPSAEKLFTTAQ